MSWWLKNGSVEKMDDKEIYNQLGLTVNSFQKGLQRFVLHILRKQHRRTGFSSRCIFDIYCYNPSGVNLHVWHTHTHTCTHVKPPNMPSITVFQQTIGAFLKTYSKKKKKKKNPPEELLKTVTDPDPGPAVIFFWTTKWKRNEGQCFHNSFCTSMLRTLKQTPSLRFIRGRGEDTGDSRRNWFRSGSWPGTVI